MASRLLRRGATGHDGAGRQAGRSGNDARGRSGSRKKTSIRRRRINMRTVSDEGSFAGAWPKGASSSREPRTASTRMRVASGHHREPRWLPCGVLHASRGYPRSQPHAAASTPRGRFGLLPACTRTSPGSGSGPSAAPEVASHAASDGGPRAAFAVTDKPAQAPWPRQWLRRIALLPRLPRRSPPSGDLPVQEPVGGDQVGGVEGGVVEPAGGN